MTERKKDTFTSWVDPDDIPDTSGPEWDGMIAKGVLTENGKVIRRGRPPSDVHKVRTTLRLDPEIVAHFKAGGKGWQTRINDALAKLVSQG